MSIKKIISENNYAQDDCSDIIYIGDGLTDAFAMEYVKKIMELQYLYIMTKIVKK